MLTEDLLVELVLIVIHSRMVDRKLEVVEQRVQELSIAKIVGDREGEGIACFNLGNAYYNLADFKQAAKNYSDAVSIFKEAGFRAREGQVYCNLGVAHHSMGNFKQAIEYHKQNLSIAKEVGDRVGEGKAYGNLGNAYNRLGDFEQALEYHKQNLDIAKEVGDRAGERSAYGNLGNACHKLGNFEQAIDYTSKVLSIAKEVGDRAGEGKAYGNLGNVSHSMGNFNQAVEYHKQALSIAKELGVRPGEAIAYCNLGNAYNRMGNFKQAIDYHKQHLSIAKEIRDRAGEGRSYCNLGNAYHCIGNFTQAIEYHKQDLSIAKEVGDRTGEGRAYGNLGNAYNSQRNFKQAIEYHMQHLCIAKEVGDKDGEGNAYGSLGQAYYKLGDFKQAIEYHKQNLSIAKELGNRAGEGDAYGDLGNAYYSLGDLEQAIKYHEQSFSICKQTGELTGEGIACYSLGRDHEFPGSLDEALKYYLSSIKHFDEARRRLQSEDAWKISLRDNYRSAYTALWRTLLKNGEIDEALYAAEKGRAQALMDVLQEQYHIHAQSFMATGPKETISSLLKYQTTQTLFIALDKTTISFWVLRKGSKIHFRQNEIEYGSADLLIETALKEIGVGVGVRCENRSLDKLRSDLCCSRKPVEKTVGSSASPVNTLQLLYDVLIGPVPDLLQGDELMVVPDGPFCLAPYSALSESTRIRTAPSLTAFKLIAGAPDDFHSKIGALLVGDPWLKEVTNTEGVPIFQQLQYAKEEVELIGTLLQATPLTGRNATKTEVLKRMKSVALVHIAAHGCQETGEIALAPNPERASHIPEWEDFILTMSDVQAVRLRARLVVLSCCHSGQGEVKSEGVVGIARAFLCAGARSVLVSLWAIDDEATLLFMRSFYQQLADRKRASAALQYAMKSLRGSKEYCAAKDWAPFVLIGDDVTLEFGEQN